MKQAALALGLALIMSAPAARAQHYPDHPIKVIVPLPPGTTADLTMRVYGEVWQKEFGVPFIVEPKPGAQGLIAGKALYNAKPDGYTVGFVLRTMITKDVKTADYDPSKFAYATYISRNELYLVVAKDSKVKDVGGLIKENPELYGVVSPGARISGLQFAQAMGMRSKLYPSGEQTQLLDLKSGRVGFALIFDRDARNGIQNGDLRALAIVSPERSTYFPEIPTLEEAIVAAGRKPYPLLPFYAAMAFPPGTPQAIVEQFSKATCKAAADPAVQGRLSDFLLTKCTSPQDMRELADRSYQQSFDQSSWVQNAGK